MTSMITARVDTDKRKAAEKVFSEVGLTTSGAVNLFICAVALTGGIPFPVTTTPSPTTNGQGARTPPAPSGDKSLAEGIALPCGIRIGLADNRFVFPSDFDAAFDAMDADNACRPGPDRGHEAADP